MAGLCADERRAIDGSGAATAVIEGLREPQGLAIYGENLYVVDAGAHELLAYSLKSKKHQTIASNLPVGAAPGVVPKVLMGIPGLLPGPLRPFAGVTAGSDGKLYVAADGDGSIIAVSKA